MVRIHDILRWLDAFAPFEFASSWDRCGLLVGDPGAPVERVLVALDPTAQTLGEAVEMKCECLVTHHPLFIQPLKAIRADQFPGNLITHALRHGVNLVAAHTNLDVALGGTNDTLAGLLGLGSLEPFEAESRPWEDARYAGLGRIGMLPRAVTLRMLAEDVRRAAGGRPVRVVGDSSRTVQRVALCTGSGGSLVEAALHAGVDVYVTGDVKYHEAQRAYEDGLALVDMGHFASERIIVGPLAEVLRSQASKEQVELEIFTAVREEDPFWMA